MLLKFNSSCRCNFVVVALCLATAGLLSAAANAAESEARLRQTITYLASDALEGRGVGTAGLDKAADYIAAEFSRRGLNNALFHGTPFQEFDVTLSAEKGPPEHNRLTLVGPAK